MLEPPFVMRIARAELVDFCTCCLRSVGMRRNDAELTAKLLVDTDARGIYTHGTASLRRYVQLMRDGGIDPRAEPSVTNEGLAWAQMDAGLAVGMVAGQRAMGQAIAKAKVAGVGLVTVQRSNHFGAASAYAMMALEHSMAALAMSNTDVVMNLPGGRGPQLGNNPLSYAIPAGAYPPLVLDIAMSTVAGGKVHSAAAQGEDIPADWLTDAEGRPTTDPAPFGHGGALTPFAAHKGYGLALLVECFAGALAGAAMTLDVLSWANVSDAPCDEGHAFIAIDVAAMMPIEQFRARVDELIERMRGAPKAAGIERIYVPGEMEWACEREATRHGVPLTALTVDSLKGLAADVRVDGPF